MRVDVRSIQVQGDVTRAVVHATSAETYTGHPVAVIEIVLRLPSRAMETPQARNQRVKDEALRFLDVA